MEQRLTSARIVSRLVNLPICVYDLRDSLTYKPLIMNLGSTDPIALAVNSSDTHLSARIIYTDLFNAHRNDLAKWI